MRHFLHGLRLRRVAGAAVFAGALALLGASGATSARLSVCTAGCRYATIPAALAAAHDGDTIAVGAGTYSGEFTIDVSVRLVGAGQGATFITGHGFGGPQLGPSVVSVAPGTTVKISDVTISGGFAAFNAGGGIDNNGDLTLIRSTLERNGSDEGGGIHNHADASATIVKSTVRDNLASSLDNPCCGQGGGIYNEGVLRLDKTAVVDNDSSGDFGDAGGIVNFASMTLTDSRVAGNTSVGLFGAAGGGIDNAATMILRRTAVSGNTAEATDGFASGGGIRNGGTVTLIASAVTGNTALGAPTYGSSGGGISNDHVLTLIRSAVTGNAPDDCAGC